MSLSSLRDIVELVSGVTPNQQKLLHKGRILKGEDSSLQALGLKGGDTLTVVRGGKEVVKANSALHPSMIQGEKKEPQPSEADIRRQSFAEAEKMKRMVKQNPEMGQVMKDPATIRQMMELMSNPELLKQTMMNADRAINNVQSHPMGYNALRRLYTGSQERFNDTDVRGPETKTPVSAADANNSPNAPTSAEPPAAPVPNPWAPAAQNQRANQLGRPGRGFPPFPFSRPDAHSQPNSMPFNFPGFMPPRPIGRSQTPSIVTASPLTPSRSPVPPSVPPSSSNSASVPSARASTLDPASDEEPEQRFAAQLLELELLGFSNRAENLDALALTDGNVDKAIQFLLEKLLNNEQ